jgi:probable HAF family extracellular repeat protein
MYMRRVLYAVVTAALCGCHDQAPITRPLDVADDPPVALVSERRYEIVRLPTLGGTDSRAQAINNQGWVAGVSHMADGSRRAVLWRDDQSVLSLGTLGGLASTVARPGLNNHGMIVGISHSTDIDLLNETWSCEATAALPPTNPRQACRGFWWENGVLRELPTLGGTHAFANSVNGQGQVIGWAETTVHDPTCTGVQVLQFRGALWEPRKSRVQELPPFPGDSASAATGINERGQIVGISGECDQAVGRRSALRMVLWEGDSIVEIPHLGGTTWHTAWAINNRGDVVGFSNLPEPVDPNDFNGHAFYWRYGSATSIDLGTLDADLFSQATGINGRGQVVGVSHGNAANILRAFIWEDTVSKMVDLNDLADLGPNEIFEFAHDINDAGQIAGRIRNTVTGERVAIVASPKSRLP